MTTNIITQMYRFGYIFIPCPSTPYSTRHLSPRYERAVSCLRLFFALSSSTHTPSSNDRHTQTALPHPLGPYAISCRSFVAQRYTTATWHHPRRPPSRVAWPHPAANGCCWPVSSLPLGPTARTFPCIQVVVSSGCTRCRRQLGVSVVLVPFWMLCFAYFPCVVAYVCNSNGCYCFVSRHYYLWEGRPRRLLCKLRSHARCLQPRECFDPQSQFIACAVLSLFCWVR